MIPACFLDSRTVLSSGRLDLIRWFNSISQGFGKFRRRETALGDLFDLLFFLLHCLRFQHRKRPVPPDTALQRLLSQMLYCSSYQNSNGSFLTCNDIWNPMETVFAHGLSFKNSPWLIRASSPARIVPPSLPAFGVSSSFARSSFVINVSLSSCSYSFPAITILGGIPIDFSVIVDICNE